MANIRKRNRKYQVQVRRKGFGPVSKSFGHLKDAQEWARLYEIKADREELSPDCNVLKELALRDLVIRYKDEIVPTKKGVQIETIILNAFLNDTICNKKLSNLS